MADSVWTPTLAADHAVEVPRHSAVVRVTHWLTALCFLALLVSGIEILISHPRFYWGEDGNVMMTPLFALPIPASRATVPTGYGYVLHDQNGWSRSLHFEAAWAIVFTGLWYVISGLVTRHFARHLLPLNLSWNVISDHLRFKVHTTSAYNGLQRAAYLGVVFVLFPLMIWTGLAMSPAITSVFPWLVNVLGGQQSARTVHFFVSISLVLFLVAHVAMVVLGGFGKRMRSMIMGNTKGSI